MKYRNQIQKIAHYSVSKASDLLEAQRIQFHVKDIQKKQKQIYLEIGHYVAQHQESIDMNQDPIKNWMEQLAKFDHELHHLDGPITEDESIICPYCGSPLSDYINFCSNCGRRISQ